MSFGVTDDVGSNGRHRAREAADHSEYSRRRPRREAWDSPPPVDESRRRPDPLTDPLGALEPQADEWASGDLPSGERPPRRERRGFGEAEDLAPGRSMLRREDPARMAARAERREHSQELERSRRVEQQRVAQQRRPDPADDAEYRGRVLPRRSDRPRDAPEAAQRPRGVADTGDRLRRSGEVVERPRGVADTGDRPRGVADTGDRPRGAARASVPVAGRAVVPEPVFPDAVRPEPRPEPRPERTSGRVAPVRGSRATGAASRTPTGESEAVRRVNPFDLPEPRGYSHATIATGQLVVLSAQSGVDLDGRIVGGGLVSQFDRAVQNLLSALAAVGGSPEHLVSITVQVTSIDEYKANSRPIGHVWRARLGGLMPALSVSEVRRFWDADAEIQIAAQAVL